MNILVLLLSLISLSLAQISTSPSYPTENSAVVPELVKPETSPIKETIENAEPTVPEGAIDFTSSVNRANSKGSIMIGYQLITSWLPSKKSVSYTHIFNEKWSLEGEYSWSTINDPFFWVDLGSIREERFNLQARRYVGNSFHFSFGAVYSEFRAKLGSDFLNDFGREISSSFRAQNIGVTGGIGNRWQWKNGFTVGVDWIRLNVPVVSTYVRDDVLDSISDDDEQDDVKKVINTFNRIPTFVLFGLNLGYTF